MENQTENVAEEIQDQAPVQAAEAPAEEIVSTPETPETQTQSDKEYNFNQLRKSKELLENRVGELEDYLKRIDVTQQQAPRAPNAQQEFELGDDDLAEGKHLKKVYQELQTLRNQITDEKNAAIPERLKTKFEDFDEVVSKKNIEKLKQREPELYASITSGTDLYRTGVSAYKALKGLGIVEDNFTNQKDQVQSNHNRPLSTQAIKGHGALSEKNVFAGGLTPELKKQLQKEMVEAAKAH